MGKKKKNSGSKTRDWIIRGVIFGVLGVVLVLAIIDNRVKKQATETGITWRELLHADKDNPIPDPPPLKKFEDEVHGSPDVSELDERNIYTWKGPFREYVITLDHYGGDTKQIRGIRGPGDDAEK